MLTVIYLEKMPEGWEKQEGGNRWAFSSLYLHTLWSMDHSHAVSGFEFKKKKKFNLGHNDTFWKITFHNKTSIPFYVLSSKISPALAAGESSGPQHLPQQQGSPGLAAASPVCLLLFVMVSSESTGKHSQ